MAEETNTELINALTTPPSPPPAIPEELRKIKVDGQEIEVRDLEHLRALAQKGASFEPKYNRVSQEAAELRKRVEGLDALAKWRTDGDIEAYKTGLKAIGYTEEEIKQMTTEITPDPAAAGGTTGDPSLLQELREAREELKALRELAQDRESHTIRGLIEAEIRGNNYIKSVLQERDEDGSRAVLDFLVAEATKAAQAFVRENPYRPSSDRVIAEQASKAAIEQARKLGLSASTLLGRGGGPGGPGEVKIEPPKMPDLRKAAVSDIRSFVSRHLTNALNDRQARFGADG